MHVLKKCTVQEAKTTVISSGSVARRDLITSFDLGIPVIFSKRKNDIVKNRDGR
jgi:hypothetical protein